MQMGKSHDPRELDPKKGEKGRELERKAHLANERIKRIRLPAEGN